MIDYRNFYYTPEQMLQYAGFKKCKKCGGNVLIVNDGEYKCEECGEIYYDDYGKIKKYMENNKGATIQEIVQATGVSRRSIKELLSNCKLEIVQPSNAYIKCNVCGAMLTCGSICNRCGNNMTGNDYTNARNRLILNKIGDKIRAKKQEEQKETTKRIDTGSKLLKDLEEKKKRT